MIQPRKPDENSRILQLVAEAYIFSRIYGQNRTENRVDIRRGAT